MKLVYPFVDKEPNMVMIEAVPGSQIHDQSGGTIVVYKDPAFTDVIYDIYGY